LQIKASLENVTDLAPDGEDFRWYLKLKCNHCGDETPEYVYLDLLNSQPLKGGRGQASLVLKCKLCSRENSIDIIKDSLSSYSAEESDRNAFKTIVAFDCRGVEPTDFSPRVGFCASGVESGASFKDIDLSEEEWCDYDENAKETVGVYELEHKFVKMK